MLENKKIITHKEAEAININKVYQFTKSKIWEEMIHAHAEAVRSTRTVTERMHKIAIRG